MKKTMKNMKKGGAYSSLGRSPFGGPPLGRPTGVDIESQSRQPNVNREDYFRQLQSQSFNQRVPPQQPLGKPVPQSINQSKSVVNTNTDLYKIEDELKDFFLDTTETIIIWIVLIILTMVKVVLSIQDKVSVMIILKDIIMAICVFIIYRCSKKEMDCGVFPLLLLAIFFIYLIHYIITHFINKNKKKEEKEK